MKKNLLILLCGLLPVISHAQLTETNLPIIKINTNGISVSDTQSLASMSIIKNTSGNNSPTDAPVFTGNIGIKLRGSTTAVKPNYTVETWTTFKEEIDTSLLGMPSDNDWALLGMYVDRSLLRNMLANNIYTAMGYWAPRLQLCEVLVNNVYQGVYLFGETIKRDSLRLDIAKLKSNDSYYPVITGGYILKIDNDDDDYITSDFPPPYGTTGQSIKLHFDYPEDDEITNVQKAYIQGYVDSFEAALDGSNFEDELTGWRAFASHKSFRDYLILNEVIGNEEAYRKNTYVWKDKSKKLRVGPLWNADNILYNTTDCNTDAADAWMYQHGQSCPEDTYLPAFWWEKLLSDPSFLDEVKCGYTNLRESGKALDTAVLFSFIDATATTLNQQNAQQRNFTLYPIFGTPVNDEPLPLSENYDEEIAKIKQYLRDRLAFLDSQWLTDAECVDVGVVHIGKDIGNIIMMPNPASDQLTVQLELNHKAALSITAYNILGQKVLEQDAGKLSGGMHTFQINCAAWAPGMYSVVVRTAEGVSWSGKLIKK